MADIRASAEKWRTGLAVSSGVTAAVGVFVSTDRPAVGPIAERAIVILIAFAIASAIVSIALALRASAGWPRSLEVSSAQSYRNWEMEEAERSAGYLHWSVRMALFALVMAGSTAVIATAAPRTDPAVEVTRTNGIVSCGQSLTRTANGYRLERSGTAIGIPEGLVASVRSVESCSP